MPILDCHAHVEPRMLDLAAVIAKMDQMAIDKVVLIPAMNDPLPETPAALLTLLRALMTTPLHSCAAWLSSRFMTPDGHLTLGGTIYPIYPEPDNQTVADAMASIARPCAGPSGAVRHRRALWLPRPRRLI